MRYDPEQAVKPEPPQTRPAPELRARSRVASPVGGNALTSLDSLTSRIVLEPDQPWRYTVTGPWSTEAVERALYGADPAVREVSTAGALCPKLLEEPYRGEFHAAMHGLLTRDIEQLEYSAWKLVPREATQRFGRDDGTILRRFEWWSARHDIRTASGECSYFDAFLAQLHGDRWRSSHELRGAKDHSYLDLLCEVCDPTVVHRTIDAHSEHFRDHRPVALQLHDERQQIAVYLWRDKLFVCSSDAGELVSLAASDRPGLEAALDADLRAAHTRHAPALGEDFHVAAGATSWEELVADAVSVQIDRCADGTRLELYRSTDGKQLTPTGRIRGLDGGASLAAVVTAVLELLDGAVT